MFPVKFIKIFKGFFFFFSGRVREIFIEGIRAREKWQELGPFICLVSYACVWVGSLIITQQHQLVLVLAVKSSLWVYCGIEEVRYCTLCIIKQDMLSAFV